MNYSGDWKPGVNKHFAKSFENIVMNAVAAEVDIQVASAYYKLVWKSLNKVVICIRQEPKLVFANIVICIRHTGVYQKAINSTNRAL